MIRKHDRHIVGGVQAAKVVVAIAILLGAAIVFMHRAAAQTTEDKKLAVDSGSADPIDVNAMLQSALRQKLEFTRGEIEQIANVGQGGADWIEELTRRCNKANFVDHTSGLVWGDAVQGCGLVANWGAKSLGVNNAKVELAYRRACALPRAQGLNHVATELGIDSEFGNYCAGLGDLYRQRGDVNRALAIYQHAPNCHASGFEPAFPNLFDTACPLGADQILETRAINVLKLCSQASQNCSAEEVEKSKQNEMRVEADFHQLCTRRFSGGVPPVCYTHLNEQEQEAAERYWEQASALAHERADQEYEQRQAAERAHDAKVNGLVNAIRSLPGGNDPNAIVDTANQQAANMVALGAANDAARAQAAAENAAARRREQIAEQQREAQAQMPSTPVAVVNPTGQSSAPLGSVNPEPPASQDGATPSGAAAPQTGGSNASGSDQFTSPMAPSCVRMFNDASMNGWVALQNTCSQKMTVTYAGKSGNGGVFGTMALAPGQSDNTGHSPGEINAVGGINWYPCPYGYIPTTMDGHDAVTAPVAEYTCKYRGY